MTEVKEQPILFNGEMVRALLAETKTQTRRIVKSNAFNGPISRVLDHGHTVCDDLGSGPCEQHCPYGKPGDRLWVRETFRTYYEPDTGYSAVRYRADGESMEILAGDSPLLPFVVPTDGWRPSIHMPRWASRILLEITEVRVQRLQEISEEDCLCEGVSETQFWNPKEMQDRPFEEKWWDDFHFWNNYPPIAFQRLWQSINGVGSWNANPWVWAVSFKVVQP